MDTFPSQGRLQNPVQLVQRHGCWSYHAAPDHRTDPQKPNLQLNNFLGCIHVLSVTSRAANGNCRTLCGTLQVPPNRAHRLSALPPIPHLRLLFVRIKRPRTILHLSHSIFPKRLKFCAHPLKTPLPSRPSSAEPCHPVSWMTALGKLRHINKRLGEWPVRAIRYLEHSGRKAGFCCKFKL